MNIICHWFAIYYEVLIINLLITYCYILKEVEYLIIMLIFNGKLYLRVLTY